MKHLLAFTKASAGGVALEDVIGVQDDWAFLNGSNHYVLPQDMQVRMAYNLSPNVTAAQLQSPHLRSVALPAMPPYDIGTNPTSVPAIAWINPPYLTLKGGDDTSILQSDNAAGAIQKYAFLLLQDSDNRTVSQNEIITLRATAAIVLGNKVWGAGTFAFDQVIPYGLYEVVGMDVVGANLIAARLLFQAGGPRPGVLARTTHATKPDSRFRFGSLGSFGTFQSTAPPSIQLFGSAAPTTQEIFLDVIKRG